jgi:hypothetical protein
MESPVISSRQRLLLAVQRVPASGERNPADPWNDISSGGGSKPLKIDQAWAPSATPQLPPTTIPTIGGIIILVGAILLLPVGA